MGEKFMKCLKFSLVHPSRGRPLQALRCAEIWIKNFSGHNSLEYILSLDTDDAPNYKETIKKIGGMVELKVTINPNPSIVPALNTGAKLATGDVLMCIADDVECPSNWDLELQKAIGDRTEFVVAVSDGIQPRIQTLQILSKTYYDRFGYVFYPKYISLYADIEFTEVAYRLNKVIKARHLLFRHRHYSQPNGLPLDNTYLREKRPEAYVTGKALYIRRAKEGFPKMGKGGKA